MLLTVVEGAEEVEARTTLEDPVDRTLLMEEASPVSFATREQKDAPRGEQEERDSSLVSWGLSERTSTPVPMEIVPQAQRKRRGDERKDTNRKDGTSGFSEEDQMAKVRRLPLIPPEGGVVQAGTPERHSPSAHEEAQEVIVTKAEAPSGETKAAQPQGVSQEGIKANLGRGARAQDLWVHRIRELSAGLGVATEPNWVPISSECWFGSPDGSVAMVADPAAGTPPCILREKGPSYVAVDWRPITVVGVYLPHHRNKAGLGNPARIKQILDRIGDLVRKCHPRPVVIAGDFNSHSEKWGCSLRQRNPSGEVVIGWAAGLGLLLLNRESTGTCIMPGGVSSVIDLTWAYLSVARMVSEWRVEVEGETLSDHRYIV
ncbi:uncharacterized protein LOC112589684 [Harpegnathos saltator]|uniref:uncharacterized protein LOC112589684 n=1 Tax=Harpegnathos saltator TaxID=610380 RepID=UPI000DBED5C2|nr:uncharacterized protein LOC112589684 [Harpegnathos saltator]